LRQTVEEALLAEREGADYLGVGAVFPTGTKADANAVSYDTLRDICAAVSIPVIRHRRHHEDNVARLSGSGIVGCRRRGLRSSRSRTFPPPRGNSKPPCARRWTCNSLRAGADKHTNSGGSGAPLSVAQQN